MQLELEIERPDSGNRCLNWLGGVIYDREGKMTGMHGTAQDITERKEIELRLLESEDIRHESQRIAKLGHYVLDVEAGTWTSSAPARRIMSFFPGSGSRGSR